METIQRVQRVTSKGQITLPIAWRRRMGARSIIVRPRGDVLEISPVRTPDEEDKAWITVFDAMRDNSGGSIKATDLMKILKKIDV